MASENLIKIALRLARSLGANEQKFLGTRSNVNFLGKGPSEGGLFQSSINTEALRAVPLEKALPEIETAMAYATGGKLNDIQVNKLIDNMSRMEDFYHPKAVANITDMASGTGDLTPGGLEYLRRTGVRGAKQPYEEAAAVESPLMSKISDRVKNIKNEMGAIPKDKAEVVGMKPTDETLNKLVEEHAANAGRLKQLDIGDRPGKIIVNYSEYIKLTERNAQIEGIIKNARKVLDETEQASAIMETVPKNDVAGKTASSREFLLNALKEGDEVGRVTFRDTVTPQDLKYITEGGGGVDGDPIVLVQKYFGPRVAELIPATSSVEDMVVFTKRVLETATDAKGLRPSDPGFDKFTLKLQESVKETPEGFPFAKGGRVPFQGGGADMGDPGKASERAERGYGQTADTGSRSGTNDYSTLLQNFNHNFRDSPDINPPVIDAGLRGPLYNTNGITAVDRVKEGSVFNVGNIKDDDDEKKTSAMGLIDIISTENSPLKKAANYYNDSKKAILEFAAKNNMAEGGRAGYRVGGIAKAILKKINKKTVKKAVDDIFETGDYKYDAELAAEALVENNPKLFGGKLIDDIDEGLRSEIYGLTLAELSSRMALKMQARRAGSIIPKDEYLQVKNSFDNEILGGPIPGTRKPRQFQLSVEKAMSELNIPREEAMRIARLTSSEQKLALQKYMDTDLRQRSELMNYTPKKFDAAHGGLAKILEV